MFCPFFNVIICYNLLLLFEGCIHHPKLPDRCVFDPCGYYVNMNDCLLHANEKCVPVNDGCRMASSCDNYSSSYIDYCDEVETCAILGGVLFFFFFF
jgi:hypothetical protein